MTQFDQEMKIFEEIKNKFKPIKGFHLVLDLDEYKKGQAIIRKFELKSEEYRKFVNIEAYEKNKEIVIISSNGGNCLQYDSKSLFLMFDYDRDIVFEFLDKAQKPHKLKRTLKQQMDLLVYDLTHPKPDKPVC